MSESSEITASGETAANVEIVGVRHGMFGVAGSGDTSGFDGLITPIVLAQPATRPYGGWFDGVVDLLAELLAEQGITDAIEMVQVDRGELTLNIAPAHIVTVAKLLRDDPDLRFELSLGVSGVHYPGHTGHELHAVYHLLSITHQSRQLRLEVAVPDADPHIPSTVGVYPTNDWHERETYDMFGIVFDGHPALARILMPDDWLGHPQRKDYPLGGIPVEFMGAVNTPPDTRRKYS